MVGGAGEGVFAYCYDRSTATSKPKLQKSILSHAHAIAYINMTTGRDKMASGTTASSNNVKVWVTDDKTGDALLLSLNSAEWDAFVEGVMIHTR